MRYAVVALAGSIIGLAMIWLGFNFKMGAPGTGLWLSGSAALIPAAIAGALAALAIDYTIRKWS